MLKVTLTSGRYFSSEPGQSLLEAAESSGFTLPYSCRSGRCSTCKCKVTGATKVFLDETGLSAEEKLDGWVLACARSAETDLTLEIQDLSELNLPEKKMIPAKIDALELLSCDVMGVKLRLPPGRTMEFLAGQYADVIGPRGIRRSYSFAAAPKADGVEFQIRRVDSGAMSAYWFGEARVNDLLRVDGPKGTFVLRHTPNTDVVFLATGTGIAPIKSMIEWIAAQPENLQPRSVKIFWGGRTEEDLYWDPGVSLGRFHYYPVLSRASKRWRGTRGYVQDALLTMNTDLSTTQVYACGSDEMIHSAKLALTTKGLSQGAFFSDAFVASS
jgi:CDP-4-dehydro-6-deoxyglucose reductase